jgi:hypothetical protein
MVSNTGVDNCVTGGEQGSRRKPGPRLDSTRDRALGAILCGRSNGVV